MLSNVLFDLDGTLTDPKDGITRCIQFSLDHFDVNVPQADQLTWCIGPPLIESFSNLLNTTDKTILDQALSKYRKRFSETGIFENVIYPGVTPSLRRIKKAGFKVFLATSKPEVFASQILDHFNLTEFFNAIHGSELNGRLSNKSELVAHILDCENLDPKATLIVGDRVYDIIGGKNNGIMTAAVSYGYGTPEEITSSKPDVIFDSFSDIASFLELQ
ncbi:MAG: HAD hydrolase-like protein [Candidatus Desulfaltia sp.]|nr:HAD hydrolase-like protein [Candidatus Desulfaltia sp.]